MYRSSFLSILTALLFSCAKKDDTPAVQPTQGFGNIQGTVKHYYYDGVEDSLTLNTTTVIIDQLNEKTTTDSTGNYHFSHIAAGVYNIIFIRSETGYHMQSNIAVNDGSTLKVNASVHDTASWLISKASIMDSLWHDELHLMINVIAPLTGQQLYAQIYFSRKEEIDPVNSASYDLTGTFILPYNQAKVMLAYPYSSIKKCGYKEGEKIYAKLYPANPNAGYTNPATDKWVCTGTGRAYPTFIFTVPY